MKVQITTKTETYSTMVVDVPDTKPETLRDAMDNVMEKTDSVREAIVEYVSEESEVMAHTVLEENEPSIRKD